jgi:hypothetical protein
VVPQIGQNFSLGAFLLAERLDLKTVKMDRGFNGAVLKGACVHQKALSRYNPSSR